jgi:PAS domain S-box-containing protein
MAGPIDEQKPLSARRRGEALLKMLERDSKVSVTDPKGRILEVNDNFCRLSGYRREELLGQPHSIVNSGVHGREFWGDMWRTVSAGNEWRGEICNRAKDGSLYWMDSIILPICDVDGAPTEYLSTRRDITARKRFESELQESGERFAVAADSAGIGIWDYYPDRERLKWDARMYRMYGLEPGDGDEPLATWVDRLHPDDREPSLAAVAAAARGDKEYDLEFRIVRPDGEVRYLKAAARTLRDPGGAATHMTGVNIDVTERRCAELKLLEMSSLLRTVLDSASETSVIATDPALIIKVFNAGAARLLGYTADEVVDRMSLLNLHDPQDLGRRAAELTEELGHRLSPDAVLIEPAALDRERHWTYVRKDGTHVKVSLVVSGMYTLTGELIGYIGVAHDVTRQTQYEESLRDATHRAEQANRAKSQFLANMSHEIRTPMNAVIGLAYLLTQTQLNSEQRELLAKIQGSSNTLLAILNDVLDLTKIEAEELIVECTAFSPYSLLRGICGVISMQAHAKGIDFDIDLADDLPIAIKGDATRLSQILTNLLANAVKFTERGGVTLRVTRLDGAATGAATDGPPGAAPGTTLQFVVRDTGIGIAPAAQEHLFVPFSQADASITRRYGGTGLGLSIVKSLTVLLGGDISLQSTPGLGSEFSVVLKFAPTGPESLAVHQNYADSPKGRTLDRVRVLLVDDSDINLDVTRRILELHGATVQTANNGLEACERLRQQPHDFDVVLMDVQMPLLDGYEATRHIRTELGLVDLPIIALTAGALSSERQRAFAAGMDDFIVKPFDAATLTTSILRHVRISALLGATPTAELSEPPAPETVPWPMISGIDLTDARDVSVRPASKDFDALSMYAGRMHKLTGAAGMLGANAIQQLAVDARAACVTGEGKRVARLAKALGVEIKRLGESAAPVLEEARAHADEALRAVAPRVEALKPEQLAELILSLRQQSLSARHRFDALSGDLRSMLGDGKFKIVRDQVENLKFMEAAKVIEDSGPPGSVGRCG